MVMSGERVFSTEWLPRFELLEPRLLLSGSYLFEFSLDIGSDTEVSDPNADGDEAFDPGDVYLWQSGPVVPPGRDGFKDDQVLFAADPSPDPPASPVPVGTGGPVQYPLYFDLDGHDQLDVDLTQIVPPDEPVMAPIEQFPSSTIYVAEFLMISLDDDQAPGWPAGDVPTTADSPNGWIFGADCYDDEIIGVTVTPGAPQATWPIDALYWIADEVTVHQSLAPNPPDDESSNLDDDDVDSLDIVADEGSAAFWYFSPDHEANYQLDPGGIYLAQAGATVLVVRGQTHLGLVDDPGTPDVFEHADVDAFEFAWLPYYDSQQGRTYPALGVLFSVDEDDPLTDDVDESGGLDPTMVYASLLDGGHWEFLGYGQNDLRDDVDAITVWSETLQPPELDYGDAPPDVYPTSLADDGARHAPDYELYLGETVDVENHDYGHVPFALGDDVWDYNDDEDGVIFLTPLVPGQQATVRVIASADGYLDAWIDFTGNGDWSDPFDHVFTAEWVLAGPNDLPITVPAVPDARAGAITYSRWRISDNSAGLDYRGEAIGGEVEDHLVSIEPLPETPLDFGDAPENEVPPTYPTTRAADGARHVVDPTVHLGAGIDDEPDGQPSTLADGDDLDIDPGNPMPNFDDEDGVQFLTPFHAGEQAQVEVVSSIDGWVDVFIDFNRDGTWGVLGESLSFPVTAGVNVLAIDVPDYASAGETYARFRLSYDGALPWFGPAPEGEVEDYLVEISAREVDEAETAWGEITLIDPTGQPEVVEVTGYLETHVFFEGLDEGDAGDDDGNNLDEVQAEIVYMDMLGFSSQLGEVIVRLYADAAAPGLMEEMENVTPGILDIAPFAEGDFAVDSFFDITYEIEVPNSGVVLHAEMPKHLAGQITHKPAAPGDVYADEMPVNLLDEFGAPTGWQLGLTLLEPGAVAGEQIDYGDAPDDAEVPGYPTLEAHNGASHVIAGPWLGVDADAPDAEGDGQPDGYAEGDDLYDGNDDENGAILPPLLAGHGGAVTVFVNDGAGGGGAGRAYLDAWIDFNGDQVWDASEQIHSGWLPHGPHVLTFPVPKLQDMPELTFARFRVNSLGPLDPTGPAGDGEVEDHVVEINTYEDAKYVQWPDLTTAGIDVKVDEGMVLADDFECTFTSALTDVHLWGSWLDDVVGEITNVHLSIHEDDPAGPGGVRPDNEVSMPGEQLWATDLDEYDIQPFYELEEGMEWWWDPMQGLLIPEGDTTVWELDLYIPPEETFIQRGTPDEPVTYWLDVSVDVAPAEPGETQAQFGWKTRQWPDHYADAAVFWDGPEWHDLQYTRSHPYAESPQPRVDLAFALTFEELAVEIDVFETKVEQILVEVPGAPADAPALPVTDGLYRVQDEIVYTGPSFQAVVTTSTLQALADPPPIITDVGSDEVATFQAVLAGLVTADLGAGMSDPLPGELTGPVETITFNKAGRTTGSFDTEMVSMSLAGEVPGLGTVLVRESPSIASVGHTTIGDLDDGRFFVDSFFDVFTELSVDGGATWIPAATSGRIELVRRVSISAVGSAVEHVYFEGPLEGIADDDDGNGLDEVHTQLVSLDLAGTSDLGPVEIHLRSDVPSVGEISEQVNVTTGVLDVAPFDLSGFPAESFFDVWPEITIGGQTLITDQPIPIEAVINHKPPVDGERYVSGPGLRVELIDPGTGLGTGIFVVRAVNQPDPTTEHDLHEDSTAVVELDIPGVGPISVAMTGVSAAHVYFEGPNEGDAVDDDLDGLDEVTTEMVTLSLAGTDPLLGDVYLRLRSDAVTIGGIAETEDIVTGVLDLAPFDDGGFPAESFFDVFYEIEIPSQGLLLHNDAPSRWQGEITHKPADPGDTLTGPDPVELLDETGLPTGVIVHVVDYLPAGDDKVDWGDAPDDAAAAGYPTLSGNGGASHVIAGPWLGDDTDKPDGERDGQPDPHAFGDDTYDGNDDEDGAFLSPLAAGESGSVVVVINDGGSGAGGAYLDAWIDFNGDQVWDPAESIHSGWLSHGSHVLTFFVPKAGTVTGPTFARFRVNSQGPLDPTGPAEDGEVEDHVVEIRELPDNTKYVQWPDLSPNGIDIKADGEMILADDFECTFTSALTDVHLWGSWLNDLVGEIRTIHLSIHEDDPIGPGGMRPDNPYSMPGEQLWEWDVFEYEMYPFHELASGMEWWWDPARGILQEDGDTTVWKIDASIPPELAFIQRGTPDEPVTYWLDVRVDVAPAEPGTTQPEFGWKTRQWPEHYMDDAVWDIGSELPRTWNELEYPPEHPYYDPDAPEGSIDMAFALTFEEVSEELDFGDAPDGMAAPDYPTLAGNGGASHVLDGVTFLGTGVDAEPDGQPDAIAMGDDMNLVYPGIPFPPGDEDGVLFLGPAIPDQEVRIEVTASVGGYLNGWIDLGADGSWDQLEDHVLNGVWLDAGVTVLNVPIPFGTAVGETFARFRFSSVSALALRGRAPDGEVEDYLIEIAPRRTFPKWVQDPDLTEVDNHYLGWNQVSIHGGQVLAADDWVCVDPDPVSGIRWWGSFGGWTETTLPEAFDLPSSFHFAIWSDLPAAPPDEPWSRPDNVLWATDSLDNYTATFVGWDYDPVDKLYEACFEFEYVLPEADWFVQEEPETVFWLSIGAEYAAGATGEHPWGWKTLPHDPDSLAPDDAVLIFTPTAPDPNNPGSNMFIAGLPIHWPSEGDGWDLAFELMTTEVSDPIVKWVQGPDLATTGIDVNATETPMFQPYVLADDFECTTTGDITKIVVWGSWFDDAMPLGEPGAANFTLSLHADVPATQSPFGYSVPGETLWMGSYGPGQFGVYLEASQLNEGFLNPPDDYYPANDTMCWRYEFDLPLGEFVQQGSASEPIVYWLDVQAQPLEETSTFGWKTSFEHWNDKAVFTVGVEPVSTDQWNELIYPPGHEWVGGPIDLAFMIVTPERVEGIKWSQPPAPYDPIGFNGWDELSIHGQASPQIVADDWICTTDQPVTDVHWLGSFLDWSKEDLAEMPGMLPDGFHLTIWTDVPAFTDAPWSHPGEALWEYYAPADFFDPAWCQFVGWDIDPRQEIAPEATFQFNVDLPRENWFYQAPGQQGVYWISIEAVYDDEIVPEEHAFGWKTRPYDPDQYGPDAAVRIFDPTDPMAGSPYLAGEPIAWPDDGYADMAFALTTRDVTPPTVIDVQVSGASWTDPPYSIPVGSGAQLDPLAWGNVDEVTVVFSEPVQVAASDLALVGFNVPSYNVVGFGYDHSAHAATWTLDEPIGVDSVRLKLPDAIIDAAGNHLDGEWADAASTYPSGDTLPGGDFRFAMRFLPGDTNADETVNFLDYLAWKLNVPTASGATVAMGDVTGDDAVGRDDLMVIVRNFSKTLPPLPPSAPSSAGDQAASTAGEILVAAPAESARPDDEISPVLLDALDDPPIRPALPSTVVAMPVLQPQYDLLLGAARTVRVHRAVAPAATTVVEPTLAEPIAEAPTRIGAELDVLKASRPRPLNLL